MDARTQDNADLTEDARTHSPDSQNDNSRSKEISRINLNQQEIQKVTMEMGTSIYKSPSQQKMNLELKDPFKQKQLQNKLDALYDGKNDKELRINGKDKVIIHVEVGGDLLINDSPVKSSHTNTMLNTPKNQKIKQSYFDDMYQVNQMAQDHNIGGKNGVLNQDITNPGINPKAHVKVRIAKQQSNNSSPRRVVSLMKENRGPSHLELGKNFNNFGEYAEYVSPQMYDHQRIQQTVARQHQQIQMQNVQPQAFKRSQQVSNLQSDSVISNNSDLNKSPRQDLLGFTTLNRGSVFQNPAMLSNTENMKPQTKKELTVILQAPQKSLQPNIGRQEKPSMPIIKVKELKTQEATPRGQQIPPSILSPTSKKNKLQAEYKNGQLSKDAFLMKQQELKLQVQNEHYNDKVNQKVMRQQNQQEYLKNYYKNNHENQSTNLHQKQASNSQQQFQLKTQSTERMEGNSPMRMSRISPGRRHEPNQLTDTQTYLNAIAEQHSDENINESIQNSQQLLNQIHPRNANKSNHDFSIIINNSFQKQEQENNKHILKQQQLQQLQQQQSRQQEQVKALRRQITVISENPSLEHAAIDQYDQPWPTLQNQNNIDEWDDTGLYDQIIKKQNLKNANQKKREKNQSKSNTSKMVTPIHVKNERVTERLSNSKHINFKGLNSNGQEKDVTNHKNFPERNARVNLQQQPNIYMTSESSNKKLISGGSQAVLVGTSAIPNQQEQQLTSTAQFGNKSRLSTPNKKGRHSPILRKQGHLVSPMSNAGQYFQNSPFKLENSKSNQGPISLKSVSPQIRSYQLKLPPHVLIKQNQQLDQSQSFETQGVKLANATVRQDTQMTVKYDDKSNNNSPHNVTQLQMTSKQIHLTKLDRIIDTNIGANQERNKKGSLDTDFLINQTEDIDVWLDRRKVEVAENAEKKRQNQAKQQQMLANMANQ